MRGRDYERAWAACEEALAARDPAGRDDPDLPYHLRWVWDGRPLDGRDVLVRCYHGLGDTIQFARYLPLLRRRAASVTVEVQPRLMGLLRQLECVDRWVPFDPADPLPPSDCDIEIMELAFALRAAPGQAPPPYLHAPPALLPGGTTGLCYRAGPWDEERSIPQALLAPVCDGRPVITLVSEPTGLPVLNAEGCPFDIDTTASLVAGVDLIVTVDTMIAHLAGAMGKPTWLLLKAEPDWRWCPEAKGSDWYPSMRCYVQPEPGDWEWVIAQVACDLAAPADDLRRESSR